MSWLTPKTIIKTFANTGVWYLNPGDKTAQWMPYISMTESERDTMEKFKETQNGGE